MIEKPQTNPPASGSASAPENKPVKVPPGFEYYHPDFNKNQRERTLEQLMPYDQMHVAWNREGNRVLAYGKTHEEAITQAEKLGLNFGEIIFDFIDLSGSPLITNL
jgi:hypothetical protein